MTWDPFMGDLPPDDEMPLDERMAMAGSAPVDAAEPTPGVSVEAHSRFLQGGAFVLDAPDRIPAVIGEGNRVLWAQGEAFMIVGGNGVGKSTLAGQAVRALLFGGTFLGLPVTPAKGRVLYLAMDRPAQIRRSLGRQFTEADRARLDDRLVIWKGPPLEDVAKSPLMLVGMAKQVNATHIVVDSLKDAAVGLSDDAVGAGYNRARQMVLTEGIEVLELHHNVKRGPNGAKPTTLADVYGSTWITAGAGSVVILHGEPGDTVVSFVHAKQPAEPLGPWQLSHDHERGRTEIFTADDPWATLRTLGSEVTVQAFAAAFYGPKTDEKEARADRERARRKLDALVKRGAATSMETLNPAGGKPVSVYSAVVR